MRKYLTILLAFIIVVLLGSCDEGLLIVGFKISKPPDKLIYLQDVDSSIDLTGGEVILELKEGSEYPYSMTVDYITKVDYGNVDFSKEGLYYVKLFIHNGKSQEFPVIVASKERLQELLNTAQ